MSTGDQSPLAEAAEKALSIDELFEKDPVTMTDAEFDRVVQEFRAGRERWAVEDRSASTQGRRVKTSQGMKPKVDLKDLGIGENDLNNLLEQKVKPDAE